MKFELASAALLVLALASTPTQGFVTVSPTTKVTSNAKNVKLNRSFMTAAPPSADPVR